jgi:hypothetical protein
MVTEITIDLLRAGLLCSSGNPIQQIEVSTIEWITRQALSNPVQYEFIYMAHDLVAIATILPLLAPFQNNCNPSL